MNIFPNTCVIALDAGVAMVGKNVCKEAPNALIVEQIVIYFVDLIKLWFVSYFRVVAIFVLKNSEGSTIYAFVFRKNE